jgi:polysaccharide deacetylase family protein (PEP-CTERM system associated)
MNIQIARTKQSPIANATDERAAAAGGLAVPPRNAMTVDVEDFFHVQAFADRVGREDWDRFPCRVEANTEKVLALFSDYGVKATFFTLGWIAERFPRLIRQIVAEGHELASHGYAHHRVFEQTPSDFRADVRRTKKLLEDVGQVAIKGYRAASFSIGAQSLWALDVLAEEGYGYSSSIYPIKHDLYGMPEAPRFPYRPGGSRFVEIPLTTIRLFGRNFPCSGGGYFRLLPYRVTRTALRHAMRHDGQPCVFYFHPWEIDPGQPRIEGARLKSRARHYVNLRGMEGKLRRLLADFPWCRMDEAFLDHLS